MESDTRYKPMRYRPNRRVASRISALKPTNCFRMRGKKGEKHDDPSDPPRRRANKQRGHGTYSNDRPPVVGTVGRRSGQVRLRVVQHTDAVTLRKHVQTFTQAKSVVNTDEWIGYTNLKRKHVVVAHRLKEWARDNDGDGVREVHVNTMEGTWTTVRNFLRPFRGVHKRHLGSYIAICEFSINLKRITPKFVATLAKRH